MPDPSIAVAGQTPLRPTAPNLLLDLDAERAELIDVLTTLDERDWRRPTASPGWSIRDQAAHLAFYDRMAAIAVSDPEAFADHRALALSDIPRYERAHLSLVPSERAPLIQAWKESAAEFHHAAAGLDATPRVPWFGPDMSLLSMITARLMETWAHGYDIKKAADRLREPHSRLKHVVTLAVRARRYGYLVRGLTAPDDPVRVELTAPDGELWASGPDDASNHITGPAEEFCLVLIRRRHIDDTSLVCVGAAAREWMEIGQVYAGPPGVGPSRMRPAHEQNPEL